MRGPRALLWWLAVALAAVLPPEGLAAPDRGQAGLPARGEGPPEPRLRRFALIASSNDGGRDRTPLRFADSDAATMAHVLRRLGGLREEDLVLLTGARRRSLQASFARVRAAIQAAAAENARRELIVYYSGHSDEQGLLVGGERVGYLELRQWIDDTDADVRIGILDSCASGALIRLRGGALRPSFLSDASTSARGHAFLTSSAADEAAQESDRIGAAFFTHSLVSGLRGAADTSRDGLVTLAEAYQFAFHETLGRTQRTRGGPQHPAYDIQLTGTGDLVLTDLRSEGASLVLEDDLSGRVYVRDASGRLLVELRKERRSPVRLGLDPGRYRITVTAEARAFEGDVMLETGRSTRLGPSHLAPAQVQSTLARGPEAQVEASREGRAAQAGNPPTPTTVGGLVLARRPALGAYGGIAVRYGRLEGRDGLFGGAEAGLTFDRRYLIGVTGMGATAGDARDGEGKITLGYAAIVARYRLSFAGSPFEATAGVLAGPAGLARERPGAPAETRTVFLFEPQVEGQVNLARWLRLGVDLGYRLVASGEAMPSRGLRGVTAGAHLQLGWF
jgi:hypothetical protein